MDELNERLRKDIDGWKRRVCAYKAKGKTNKKEGNALLAEKRKLLMICKIGIFWDKVKIELLRFGLWLFMGKRL